MASSGAAGPHQHNASQGACSNTLNYEKSQCEACPRRRDVMHALQSPRDTVSHVASRFPRHDTGIDTTPNQLLRS